MEEEEDEDEGEGEGQKMDAMRKMIEETIAKTMKARE
jgi:hypothetical protein